MTANPARICFVRRVCADVVSRNSVGLSVRLTAAPLSPRITKISATLDYHPEDLKVGRVQRHVLMPPHGQ